MLTNALIYEDAPTPDYAPILNSIARCDDPRKLNNFIQNAARKNVYVVKTAAIRRFASLVPDHIPGTFAYDFWQMINAYEAVLSELRRTRIRLEKTRARVEETGMEPVLIHWVLTHRQPHITDRLIHDNMTDLTADAVLLRHKSRFPAKARKAALKSLNAPGR